MPRAFLVQKKKKKNNLATSGEEMGEEEEIQVTDGEEEAEEELEETEGEEEEEEEEEEMEEGEEEMQGVTHGLGEGLGVTPPEGSPRTPGSSPAKPDAGQTPETPPVCNFRSSVNSAFSRIERLISEPSSRERARCSSPGHPVRPETEPEPGELIAPGSRSSSSLGLTTDPYRDIPGRGTLSGIAGLGGDYSAFSYHRDHIAAMMRYGIPPPPVPRELLTYSDPRLPVTHYYLNLARLAAASASASAADHFRLQPPPAHSHAHMPRHHPGLLHAALPPYHHPDHSPPPADDNSHHNHHHRRHLQDGRLSPRPTSTSGSSSPDALSPDARREDRLDLSAATTNTNSRSGRSSPSSPQQHAARSPAVLSVPVLPSYGASPPPAPHAALRLLPPGAHPYLGGGPGVVPAAWLGGLAGLHQHPVMGAGGGGLVRPRDPTKPPAAKKYKCDTCGKSFSRSNTLVTHKRIHTGEKPFACESCGRAFRQPGNLTRHRLTHTTVKPYVCPRCGKAFNRASNLHTHMRTHTSYKPFVCSFCGKGFHQKIDMKIHSYTHTGMCGRLPTRPHSSHSTAGGVPPTS